MFIKDYFISFYRDTAVEQGASTCFDCIYDALQQKGICTDLTLIGALATARVEVGRSFLPIAESKLLSTVYELRTDLGNVKIGDGIKYRGRGYIQLTGRANYEEYGRKLGLDLLANPDLALQPLVAGQILAQYFKDRVVNVACNAQDWVLARELVNGGTNGLTAFLNIINQYKEKMSMSTKKLEITKIEYLEGGTAKVAWHRFNTDNGDQNDTGTWDFDGPVNNEQVLEHAKTMVDSDIDVSLNLTV